MRWVRSLGHRLRLRRCLSVAMPFDRWLFRRRTSRRRTRRRIPMARLIKMNFDKPEEVRPFADSSGKLELVNLAGGPVGRATFEPGWQWSKHVKPIAGTASCQASHMGYVISGHMKIVMDDGEEAEFGPGDFMVCPPGH